MNRAMASFLPYSLGLIGCAVECDLLPLLVELVLGPGHVHKVLHVGRALNHSEVDLRLARNLLQILCWGKECL